MTAIADKIARAHGEFLDETAVSEGCRCGAIPGGEDWFAAHIAAATEAAVRDTIAEDIEALPASPLYPTTYDPTSLINMSFMDGVTAGVEVARLVARGES